MDDYTLLIQKTKEGSGVKDSLSDFGFAISEIPWPSEETQDISVRVWPGEHGEDAYIPPSGLKLKAYDLEVEFIYKGEIDTAKSAYTTFRNYLTGIDGSGGELKVYDRYWKRGRKGVYVKKIDSFEAFRSNLDESVSFKVTFRVNDPVSEIVLVKNE